MRTQRNQIGVADASVLSHRLANAPSHLCVRTVRLQIDAEMKRNKEETRGNVQPLVVVDTNQSSLLNGH